MPSPQERCLYHSSTEVDDRPEAHRRDFNRRLPGLAARARRFKTCLDIVSYTLYIYTVNIQHISRRHGCRAADEHTQPEICRKLSKTPPGARSRSLARRPYRCARLRASCTSRPRPSTTTTPAATTW